MTRQYSDEKKIKYLTMKEFNSLLKAIDSIKDNDKYNLWLRDRLIFTIAFECGLRAGEIGLLKREDFNGSKNELYCRRLKGSKNNTVRLSQEVSKLLKKYLKETEDREYIFISQRNRPITNFGINKLAKKYFSMTKISEDKWKFHSLKHTCGVYLAEMGLDIKDIQYIMGHRDTKNTLIYFDYTTRQQERMYKILGR